MRTVKLVVIGPSGVGKTSIRNQYISGRFTTGYRATIGADFITKTLPHHSNPDESVTLQIWDTAGQERFSSLSSAFFRGADAVLLMFDVNQPQTLEALTKWWNDFKERAPVLDEDADKFCCVVVGNKIDMNSAGPSRVTEEQALQFVENLIPPSSNSSSPQSPENAQRAPVGEPIPSLLLDGADIHELRTDAFDTEAIPILRPRRTASASRSRSRSTLFRGSTFGTMTTATHSIYHTPSSSLFDNFESARASPAPTSSHTISRSPSRSPVRRMPSVSSMSSAPTITPSLFGRGQATTACTTPSSVSPLPPPPERRPKLFFTSAKTGEGVAEVFEYIAKRVVVRWDYEEAVEARTLHFQDASVDETIRLGLSSSDRTLWKKPSCCAS
ncbi:unnamed protein product [Somion occarium]|uniref:Ras-domain-containing protein n=1 Tax=Somion occarium TaxID=3059160 RepID=A0ABP1CRB4_9APHY